MLKKVLSWIISFEIAIIVIITGVIFIPDMIGYHSYVVETNNLSPEITKGSLAIAKKDVSLQDLATGDIIAFQDRDTKVQTYVVADIDVDTDKFYIIEDAKNYTDSDTKEIPTDKIVGMVVYHIPLIGILIQNIFNPYILMAIILMLSIEVIAVAVIHRRDKIATTSTIHALEGTGFERTHG